MADIEAGRTIPHEEVGEAEFPGAIFASPGEICRLNHQNTDKYPGACEDRCATLTI